MQEKIFADGISVKELQNEQFPWLIAQVGISKTKFTAFMEEYVDERGWINLTLKRGKTGTLYFELDTWKKEKKEWKPIPQTQKQIDEVKNMDTIEYPEEDINPFDIPF